MININDFIEVVNIYNFENIEYDFRNNRIFSLFQHKEMNFINTGNCLMIEYKEDFIELKIKMKFKKGINDIQTIFKGVIKTKKDLEKVFLLTIFNKRKNIITFKSMYKWKGISNVEL